MSSYLFILVIDLLAKKLDQAALQKKFRLHPKCYSPLITHLSFADDLLVFFDGSSTSLSGILDVFTDFYHVSGLKMNCTKSQLFLDGNNRRALSSMADQFGIAYGSLPVRYLGVPLITHKLRKQEYMILVERIQTQLDSWMVKYLSFAGRLQPLKSVINSIINFWMSIFLLPIQCIKALEKLCKGFLWTGSSQSAKGAKVSWDIVCTPKNCGGLGLKRLTMWNQIFGLKLIWNLFAKSGSLWVAWVKNNLLKGRNCSFWEDKPMQKGSWIWRRIMKLKHLSYDFLICRINSGEQTLFWLDKWTDIGPLINEIGTLGPRITGINIDATVKGATVDGRWKRPTCRNRFLDKLRELLPEVPPSMGSENKDEYHWRRSQTESSPTFSTSLTWESLVPVLPTVEWSSAIWFGEAIPKHSFTSWAAIWNRLPTRDRLRSWGLDISSLCVLCDNAPESVDHLFIHCRFAATIWNDLFGSGRGHNQQTLSQLFLWAKRPLPNQENSKLHRMLMQAIVYEIWKERNARIHDNDSHNAPRSTIILCRDIRSSIKNKLISTSQDSQSSKSSISLLSIWYSRFATTTISH